MAEEKRETVTIACKHVGGLKLALFRKAQGDLGDPVIRREGPTVTLNGPNGAAAGTNAPGSDQPGFTSVDRQWWEEWVMQNEGKNPVLDSGAIWVAEENPTS